MKSNGFQETPCVLGGVWARAPHWVLAFLAVLLLSCGPKESVQVERSRPMEGLFERPHQCVQNDPRLLPGLYRVEDPLEWPGTIVPEPALAWLWVEASDAACAPVRVLDARPGLASRERWPATWVELSEAEWAGKRMARTKDSVERGVRGRLDRAAPALVREAEYWTSVSPPHRLLRVAEVSQSAAWLDLVHGGGVEEGELLLWLGAGLQAPLRVVVYASIEDQERLASTLFALAGETSLQQLELSFERAQGEQACLSSGPLQRALDEPVAELMLWFSPGATQLGFAFGYEQPSLFSFSEYLQCIPVFDQSQLEAQLVYLLLAAAQRWTELSWRLPLRADGEASVALWREWALLRQGLLDEAETPILALLDAWWRVDLKALALAFEGLQTMSDTQRLMQVLAVWAQRGAVDAEPLLSALLAEEGLREDVRATASLLEVVLEREDWSTLEAKLQAELDARHAAPWQSVFLAANYVARSSSEDAIAALQWAMHETAARGDLRRSVQLALNLSEQEANQGFFADALRTALQAGEGLERS
ncbi:MAG: hypothetical protein RBU37_16985, partial [Myxococcota bacterium]|nr:hypothetical protein [Myxococcota bacterium]